MSSQNLQNLLQKDMKTYLTSWLKRAYENGLDTCDSDKDRSVHESSTT